MGARTGAGVRREDRRGGDHGRDPRRADDREGRRDSRLPQRHADLRGALRPPARPRAARRHDLRRRPRAASASACRSSSPRSQDDLIRRRSMMEVWARSSNGMLGRTGDYLNAAIMAMAGASEWFAQADPAFGDEHPRLLRARARARPAAHAHADPAAGQPLEDRLRAGRRRYLAARIVEEDDNGVVIRGARMLATIGPIADELVVIPVDRDPRQRRRRALLVRVRDPNSTPGLRFLCRESFDLGRSHFDHPLGSRFDEIDAVVVFDDVLRALRALLRARATRSSATASTPTPRPPCT